MRHSLRAHILYLEGIVQYARERLTAHHLSEEELEDFRLQLTLAESALEHYRRAYELELSVSGPESPGHPDSESGSGRGNEGKPNRDGGKGGRKGSKSARRRTARAFPPASFPGLCRKASLR